MQKSLLERAGLERLDKPGSRGRGRMDLLDDEPRRLFEDRNKPV
jgi:hypothetical protein